MSKRNVLIISLALVAISAGITLHVSAAGELSAKEARRLIAHLAGINLPSDAVRVKDVSSLGNSATVTPRLKPHSVEKDGKGKWRVVETVPAIAAKDVDSLTSSGTRRLRQGEL